jgi:BMFP domain-containing protein YqiC
MLYKGAHNFWSHQIGATGAEVIMIFDFSKQKAQDFLHELRQGLQGRQPDDLSQGQLRALLESLLRKLNLVTREEFDAQQAVLQRTRLKLEELEKEVAALQERAGQASTAPDPSVQ